MWQLFSFLRTVTLIPIGACAWQSRACLGLLNDIPVGSRPRTVLLPWGYRSLVTLARPSTQPVPQNPKPCSACPDPFISLSREESTEAGFEAFP